VGYSEKERVAWNKAMKERRKLVHLLKQRSAIFPKDPHSMKIDDLRRMLNEGLYDGRDS
jgi:hypothetical protein